MCVFCPLYGLFKISHPAVLKVKPMIILVFFFLREKSTTTPRGKHRICGTPTSHYLFFVSPLALQEEENLANDAKLCARCNGRISEGEYNEELKLPDGLQVSGSGQFSCHVLCPPLLLGHFLSWPSPLIPISDLVLIFVLVG